AFGREKNGIPNRQVAHELKQAGKGNINIRWCATHGEQCHSKLLIITKGESQFIIQGSANLTRRNLNNLNLETNVFVSGQKDQRPLKEASDLFEEIWNNQNNNLYSINYEEYAETSKLKTLIY